MDRARYRHRVRQVGHGGCGREDHAEFARGNFLRRRLSVGAEEYYLGGRTWSPGGHLDQQLLSGYSGVAAAARRNESHQPEDGAERVELPQRLQSGPSAEDAPRGFRAALQSDEYRSGAGFFGRADGARSAALPE